MSEPISPVILPPARNLYEESEWLQNTLHHWLNQQYIPEPINEQIARHAAQVYFRQRMEGENDLGALVIAIVTELQEFDFSKSFYSEFVVANAVSDLLMEKMGIERCCGR